MAKPEDRCADCAGWGVDGDAGCVTCFGTGLNEGAHERKRQARLNGRKSRTKGKVGEREIVHAFQKYGFTAKRGFQARGGSDAPDVECAELPNMWFECKRGVSPNWRSAMRQAAAASGSRIPVVVTRDDRSVPYVHLDLSTLLDLLAELRDLRSMVK